VDDEAEPLDIPGFMCVLRDDGQGDKPGLIEVLRADMSATLGEYVLKDFPPHLRA
jgi:hypothetical protein